jgi:RHS repeat-associated protein
MRPLFRSARTVPARRARLDIELLEDRLPISENLGTLLAVSSLAGAAESLLARSLPPDIAEIHAANESADPGTRVQAVWPNGLSITENVALAGAPHPVAPADEPVFTPTLPLDRFFAALPEDGLEPSAPADATSIGGTSVEPGAHPSGDFVGFGYKPIGGASAFGAGFAGAATGPAPAYAGFAFVPTPPAAAPSSTGSPHAAVAAAAAFGASPDGAALWQSVNSLGRTPPASPRPPAGPRPLGPGDPTITVTDGTPWYTSDAQNAGPAYVSFNRSGNSMSGLTVNFTLSGTAVYNTDYTLQNATSSTVTFAPGALTVQVAVNAKDDGDNAVVEYATFTLTAGTGYNIGTPSAATVTIYDQDHPATMIPVNPCTCGIAGDPGFAKPLPGDSSSSDALIDPGFAKPLPDVNAIDPGFNPPGLGGPAVGKTVATAADDPGLSVVGADALAADTGEYDENRIDMVRLFNPADGGVADIVADTGVRYADGAVVVRTGDLASNANNFGWGQTRDWTSQSNWADGYTGSGMELDNLPHLRRDNSNQTYLVISNGYNARPFDVLGSNFTDRYFLQDSFVYNSANHEYVLTDTMGDQVRFNDYTVTPTAEEGTFKSFTDPYGNVVSVVSYTSGLPGEVQRSSTVGSTTITESYLYSYNASNLMTSAVLRRQINGGAWSTVRQTAYTYYASGANYGNVGDLEFAQIEDPSGNVLDTTYYRYGTSNTSTTYTHGLKYVFGPQAYARLTAANGTSVDSLTDTQVSPYADKYFEYDSSHRVTKAILAGAGGTTGGGNGLGTYTYSYTTNAATPVSGPNFWKTKVIETLPDNNQNIVYTNQYGEVMLAVYKDVGSGNTWDTFTKYDDWGRAILTAGPSAVTGYDDTKNDLLNYSITSGTYQYLATSSGRIDLTDYGTSTTATSSTAGDVFGDLKDTKVEQGQSGTPITTEAWNYIARTTGGGFTLYKTANDTVYRNTDGTGGETTSFSYTWVGTTAGVQSVQATLPVISSGENGPGVADAETLYLDGWGRPVWFKDADGFIAYAAWDQATGGLIKTIRDVNTANTGDFMNLPSGWSTPSGGGLHLLGSAVVDALGRPTQVTDAAGNVTYAVYLDTQYEVRVYPGWQSGTSSTTGPTRLYREDRPGSYLEFLTMSATPHTTGGVPDGTEAIGSLQSLAREVTNSAGQAVYEDRYFNLSGITYGTAITLGTLGTNYYRTTLDYDNRGRLYRVLTPTGTYDKTLFDGLGRPVSDWVGTNDGSPGNMTQLDAYIYDGSQGAVSQTTGVGDSNLAQYIEYPGGSQANRLTNFFYDWRDRLEATKDGVQSTEATTVHRPILFATYDNLDKITQLQQYDGDGVTLTFSNGSPVKPSNTILRAEVDVSYDDQGRVYQTQVGKVEPTSGGSPSAYLTTNLWYNHRGDVIKESNPGGLVTKFAYDGAERVTLQYTSDGGGDSSWSDAGNVTSDNVLEQTEFTYDKNGNAILSVERQRNHDETGTGGLGNETTAPKARVYYAADYYDAANRPTTTVDVGTNGGTAYMRPSTPDARSDTVLRTDTAYNAAGWLDSVTDPRGIVEKFTYDNAGRVTKDTQAYTGNPETASTDVSTEYTYDGMDHVVTLQADLPSSACQQTKWLYGVTTSGGSGLNSNDIVSAVQHPDKSTGNPSSSEQDSQTVDALGETLTATDRNGNVHTLTYDVLGRLTSDQVTTLGSGVDGSVRRIDIAYDTQGNPYLFTSYADTGGTTIVNQVQRSFNGYGQLIQEWQAHCGAVNTMSTPSVQYGYGALGTGDTNSNQSRLTSITYPNGKVLTFNYNSGLDDAISRLSSLSDNSGTLESYSYLGLGTVVKRAHPQPNVDLTYIRTGTGDAGDQYTGLDRFGRVVEQKWYNNTTATATDDFKYGYDRNSNVLWRTNEVNHNFDELYHANGSSNGYDNLNQLVAFARGTLNANHDTISSPSHSINYTLDAEGNFSSTQTDGGSSVNNSFNKQNEETAAGSSTLTFDANGNLTTDDQGHTLVYDAWNRLVTVKNGGTTLTSYKYDALGRRIVENPGAAHDLYYDAAWQVLEERWAGVSTATIQYVWSPVYIDALVLRDRSTQNNGTLDERLWVQQDANYNVTALVNGSGTVVERYVYDPYGLRIVLDANFNTRTSSSYAFNIGFQGLRLDTTSGLYNARNRDLSPTLGHWVQADPLSFGGGDTNLYRAMGDEPVGAVDPSGLAGSDMYGNIYRPFKPKPQAPPTSLMEIFLLAYQQVGNGNGEFDTLFLQLLLQELSDINYQNGGPNIYRAISEGDQSYLLPGKGLAESIVGKYYAYRSLGLSVGDSIGYSAATGIPFINALTNIAEMAAGKSIEPDDFGEDMTFEGYFTRGANVFATAVTVGTIARCPKGGTYTLRKGGKVMRSGRSKNLARRAAQHMRDPQLKRFKFKVDKRTDSYNAQRGREQIIHDLYDPPLDIINPIDPKNPRKPRYMRAGRNLK